MEFSNPVKILTELDSRLTKSTELTIYGRAALAVGFSDSPLDWHVTMDVDAILPVEHLSAIESDGSFWKALEQVNEELQDSGLYFTHLFEDRQVILRPDWLRHRVDINRSEWPNLKLFRPSTADFILTKMMRVDPQDREDIEFLTHQTDYDLADLRDALARAAVPDIPEIQQAFEENRIWLENMLGVE